MRPQVRDSEVIRTHGMRSLDVGEGEKTGQKTTDPIHSVGVEGCPGGLWDSNLSQGRKIQEGGLRHGML